MVKFLVMTIFFTTFAIADNYSEFYRHCVLTKRGKFPYKIEQVDSALEEMYRPTGAYDRYSHLTVASIVRGSTGAYDEVRNLFSVLAGNEFIHGKKIRSWAISTIKSETKKYNLNNFERACLVNCATYMLIDYSPAAPTKFSSLYEIYDQGKGICTEMTDIAMDLAKTLNLKTRSMVSDEHNWPEYKIYGKWYILDPTTSGCRFLER